MVQGVGFGAPTRGDFSSSQGSGDIAVIVSPQPLSLFFYGKTFSLHFNGRLRHKLSLYVMQGVSLDCVV